MKNSNLLNRLLSYSHEKQKMGGMRRYAAMLLMLLTLGVGQMWAETSSTFYYAIDASALRQNSNCCSVEFNVKYDGTNDKWSDWTSMSKTGYTYNGKIVYSYTYSFQYDGHHNWQFRLHEGANQHYYEEWWGSDWSTDLKDGQLYVQGTGWVSSPSWDESYEIYFVDKYWNGVGVNLYAWNNECDYNAGHPGQEMTFTDCYWNSKPIYKLTLNKRYTTLQFSKKGDTSSKYDNQPCYSNAGKMFTPDETNWWQTLSYTNYSISSGATVVWDAGEESWTTAQIYYYKPNYDAADNLTRCGTSTQFYKTYDAAWSNYAGIVFRKDAGWSAKTTNITRNNSGVTLYTYCNSNTSGKLDWQVTTSAKKATSGVKIYFDNTDAQWNEIWLRYGTTWFVRSSAAAATQVTGTENLYVLTIPNDAYYASYHLANSYGATNYSDITSNYNLTDKIALQSSNLASDITYIPTTNDSGSPKTWSFNTITGHTRRLTFGSHTNGQITVRYTDESGVEQTVSSASASYVDVAQTCNVVITAVPDDGYAPSGLTLGGNSITSGATQTIRADGTIVATFVAETTYNITVSYKYGSRTLHDAAVYSVGVTTPSNISSETIDGFEFDAWSDLTNVKNNTGDLVTDPININSTTAAGSMTCNYTPWTCSLHVNTTSGNTGYSSEYTMSYDATAKAYYKEFTTTAETQYFRFFINSKKYAPSSNTEVVIAGTHVAAASDVTGYASNMPSVYFNDGGVGSKIKVWFDYESKEAWVEEVKYTVTINHGANGDVNLSSVSVGNVVASSTISAIADSHYHWSSWDLPNSDVTIVSGSGTKDITIKATADDKTITANFAGDNYTVVFNRNGSTEGDDMSNESFTYGTSKNLTTNTFARTGYTFQGWATSQGDADAGTVTYSDGAAGHLMDAAHNSTVELFAVWQANPYTVTLDYEETGKGTDGEKSSVSATYDAEMPALGTAPVGDTGYKFRGYFTGHNGSGTKYYNADGTSAHIWDVAEATTLYAYFEKAEIATLPLSASMVHPWVSGGTMDSITVEPTLTLVPEGTVLICYTIQYSDGSAVTDDGLQTFRVLGGNAIRFRAPKNPGSYRVHAELKTDDCSGTVLDTKNAEFAVAGDYSVTVKYVCDGKAIRDQEVLTINSLDSTSVTAPTDIFGYTFSEWEMSAGITSNTGASANPKKFVASYDGIITAKYVETPIVYFYNNLGWSDVWVTYDSYWDGSKDDASKAGRADGEGIGSGNYGKTYNHMRQIEGTNIWYDVVPSYYTANGFEHWAWNITFNNVKLGDEGYPSTYKHFNSGEAVIRYDFDPQATMFVPTTGAATFVTNGVTYKSSTSTYHNDEKLQVHNCGYWKKYNNTSSGYSLRGTFAGIVGDESNWDGSKHNLVADSPDAHEFSTKLKLYSNRDYYFRIFRNNKYLKLDKASGFTQKDLTINQSTNRVDNAFRTDCGWVNSADVTLHTSTEGEYTFYVNFQDDGTMLVTVDFPDNAGDYQVLYKDNEHTKWHPAGVIDADATENITSFFVRKDQSPVIKWRKSTAVANDGTITWGALQNVDLSSYTGSGAILDASSDQYGVYNFHFNIADNTLSLTDVDEYKGSYYIRTNCASEWKWEHYTEADHRMTYSDYAEANSGFSHYFMKYVGAGTNVKFVVANDYSICISDTMEQGGQSDYVDASSNLIANANIRFSWNMHDNSLNRAYVGMVDRTHTPREATKFIVLQGQDGYLFDEDGEELNSANQGTMYVGDDAIEFDDDENWVYETTVKAKAEGRIKIYSHVNGHDYYLVGGSPLSGDGAWESDKSDFLITGTGDDAQKIRVIYDFKTGRLISAWLPSVAVNEPMMVKADVMIVREHQEGADQINMNSDGQIQLTDGKTVYGVMRFNKYILNNLVDGTSTPLPEVERKSLHERSNYYISFPFDVKISDIFGFGSYGPDFTLRYYDGKGRAKNGYWADSNSFWKYVPPFGTLNANEGYLLSLNLNNFGTSSDFWNNGVVNIELYFPATGTIDIQQVASIDIDSLKVSEYQSTINRGEGTDGDRRIADSFWRCIGVPSFAQKEVAYDGSGEYAINWHTSGTELPFLYKVNWYSNDLEVQDATEFTFQPMHAYMVQNGNMIRWTNVIRPASVAQRTTEVNELTFRLELNKNDVKEDQTYIRLTDKETVTSAFDFGQDLSKEFRNDANIYTMIGYEKAAANSMPFSESTIVIPMGVKMSESGEYTFAMPDGTHGVSVILVDNMLNTRTNLGLLDYMVYLDAGQTDGRFSLEIAPVPQMPTDIEAVSDQQSAVRKVMIDGILYIVKDGKVFDARGAVVK